MTLVSIITIILLTLSIIIMIVLDVLFLKIVFKKKIEKSIKNYTHLLDKNKYLENKMLELNITLEKLKNKTPITLKDPIKSKKNLDLQKTIIHLNNTIFTLKNQEKKIRNILKELENKNDILFRENKLLENKLLEIKNSFLKEKENFLEKKNTLINTYELKIFELNEKINKMQKTFDKDILRFNNMTNESLKKEIIHYYKDKYTNELDEIYKEIKLNHDEKYINEAKEIISESIVKLTNSQYDDFIKDITTREMRINNLKEWKGKIIGRDKQHQRIFEKELAVTFQFPIEKSENKNILTLCSYSPRNREIAKIALEHLIKTNSFNVISITNEIEKAKETIPTQFIKDGEKVLKYLKIKRKVSNELKGKIGELSLVFSYGQNMLNHSIEVAEIAKNIAKSLGNVDVELISLCALLHDIGKVGKNKNKDHVLEGQKIINKYDSNLPQEITMVIANHHNKLKILDSIYTSIVVAADSISAGRPGIRKYSEQIVFERLQDLEKICKEIKGVEKVNILSSGFKLLIFTNSDKTKERDLFDIEQKLIKSIQEYGKVPGTIEVILYRETKREFFINKS